MSRCKRRGIYLSNWIKYIVNLQGKYRSRFKEVDIFKEDIFKEDIFKKKIMNSVWGPI